jgi:hypothetical protein
MGYLFGKLQDNQYFKIVALDSGSIYAKDEDLELISYDYRYTLEDGEWFVIRKFSEQEYGNIVSLENTTNLFQLEKGQYNKIKYTVFMDENLLFFEKITPAKVLQKKTLSFSGEPKLMNNPKIIIFNEKPDAVYNKDTNELSFRNLNVLKNIFIGIDVLYREATNEETQDFVLKSCVELSDNFNIKQIKSANRKRITMVWSNYQQWNQSLKDDFIKYANKYCQDISCENGKFIVNNEKELKHILYAMDERYYTTELQEKKRLANSVQTLEIE